MKRTIKNDGDFTFNSSGLLNSFIKVVFCMVVLSVLLSVISVKAQSTPKPTSSTNSLPDSPASTPRSHPSPVAHKSTAATTSLRKPPPHTSTATSESTSTETIVIAQSSNIPLPGRSNKTSTDPPSSATPASSRKIYDKTQTIAPKSSKTASTMPSTSSSTTTLTSAAKTRVTTKPTSTTTLITPTTKLSHHTTPYVSTKATSTVATSPKNTSPASGPPQTVSSANEVTTVVTNGRSDTSSATTSPRQTHAATSVSPTATNQSTASTTKLSTRPVTMGNSSYSDTMKPNTASADSSKSPTKTIASTSVTDNSTQVPSNQTNTTTILPPVTHKQQNGTGMANTNPVTITNTSLPSPSTATLHSSTQSRISSNQGEINMTSPAASMSENKTVTDATTHTISGATINTVSNATMRSPTNNNKTNKVKDASEKPITAATSNTFNNVSTYTISSTPTSTNTQVVANITTNSSTYSTTKTVSNAITNTIYKTTLKPTTDATPNTDNFATTSYFPTSKTTNNATIEINTATTITGSNLTTKSIAASTTNRLGNAKTNANIGTTARKTGTDIITTIKTITGAILNNNTSSSTVSSVIMTVGAQKTTNNASATVTMTGMTLTTAGSRQQTNISSVGGSSSFIPTASTTDHSTQSASPNKTASTASVTTATHSSASPSLANATKSTISFSTKSASTLLNPSPSSDSSKATDQPSTSHTTRATTTIDPCATLVCQNGGTCSSNGSVATCTCAAGYTGLNCSVDIDYCSGTPCKHGATCTDLVNGFQCSCIPGYTGNICEADIDECSSNPCQNKGNCTNLVNGFNCTCVPGYTGDTCESDIDDCQTNPCRNGGSCIDLVNRYNCTCSAGYTGDHCQTNINECQSNPCKHGNCADLVNGYKCTCLAGYTGSQCQMDINECDSSPCKNGGQCNNLVNGFNCTCAAGFNGTLCQNNIDDCVNSKCQNGATCQDGVNNYTCTCLQGWEGPYCSKDVDECTTNKHNCSKFADCINNNGSYSCNCHSGFNGDGFTCADINECYNASLNGCINGTCFNLYGSYGCVCSDGWGGDNCSQDLDECTMKTNACPANSLCTNSKGSYSCSCKEGYREEGDKCVYKVLYDIQWLALPGLHEDDKIVGVNLQQGIRYFGKTYFYAYVSTNGYISLGKRYDARIPPKSPANWPADPPVIAPLWADIDPDLINGSGVFINTLSVYNIEDKFPTLKSTCGFKPTFALMVTWISVPPYPASAFMKSEPGNFQVLLPTNGTHTSIVFNYDQTYFKWQSAPGRYVSIGYSNETSGVVQFNSNDFWKAKNSSNIGLPGRWVHRVASSLDSNLTVEANCRNVAMQNQQKSILDVMKIKFDPCPCTLAQAIRDGRFRHTGIDNNTHKFQSTFASELLQRRQLCNYNMMGSLVIGQPNGGYLDFDGDLFNLSVKAAYEDCCVKSNLCYLFYYWNPSDTCYYYKPPSWASGWGDPHITTLDGKEYTFNGRGEYVLVRTSNYISRSLEVQVRTDRVTGHSDDATVFVGLAARENVGNITGDIVEIHLNRSTQIVNIYINHELNTSYPASTVIEMEGTNFRLSNDSQGLVLTFPSKFTLQIGVADGILNIVGNAETNESSLANMTGLLGNNDGNIDNDFEARNGTLFSISSTEEELWYFGTSWMLQNQSESLFTYFDKTGFASFNNYKMKPKTFISKVENITSFFVQNCNATVDITDICNDNAACVYDTALTCNQTFGKQSKETQDHNMENAEIAGNHPPTIKGPMEFRVRYNETNKLIIRFGDDNDPAANISKHRTISIDSADYVYRVLNDTTHVLEWNITRLNDTKQTPSIRITATDSMNATSEYWPTIRYCDCVRFDECKSNIGYMQNSMTGRFVKDYCECAIWWTGERCETKIKPCSKYPCFNESSCTVVGRVPHCGPCPPGLTGNGQKCYDINECENGVAKCSQDCENTQGSYRCKCRPGYKFAHDNSSCTDIDECQNMENNCNLAANEICTNTNGSYECRCRPGFVNESNNCIEALSQFVGVLGYSMDRYDRDVSAILKAFLWKIFNTSELTLVSIEIVPLQEIHRTYRSVHPRTTRYILNSKEHMESQTAARLWNKYERSSFCAGETCREIIKGVGLSVSTSVSKIYEDSDNMLCEVEHSRCDPVSTKCFSVSGRMYCQCKAGFTELDYYLDRCDDINECANSNPCVGGTCVNTPGNFTCYCPAGYSFISGACTDLCNPSPCQNGGTCIHGQQENEYICKCDGKWAGQKCERENAEASRLQTTLIAVGASIGGVCFLLLVTLFGVCRRSRKRYESYLNRRAMSSINGYEGSKLQFYDAPYDDDMSGPSTFTIPRPQVKKSQYEMQENGSGSELGLIEDDGAAKFDDPSKPKAEAKKETEEGQGNQSFLHSEGSLKDERKRSKNPYEYF